MEPSAVRITNRVISGNETPCGLLRVGWISDPSFRKRSAAGAFFFLNTDCGEDGNLWRATTTSVDGSGEPSYGRWSREETTKTKNSRTWVLSVSSCVKKVAGEKGLIRGYDHWNM